MTRWFIGNLVTGKIINYLPVSKGSWATELNGPGTISVTVPLYDPDVANLGLRNLATSGQVFLGCAEGDQIMNAGPVWTPDYSRDDAELTLGAKGFWSIFGKRQLLPAIPAGVADPTGYDTYFGGLDTGTVVKRILQQDATANGALPLIYQADVTGASDITYNGADQVWIQDALNDLTAKVDIEFAPQFTADKSGVVWLVRTGTDATPQLSSNATQIWDMSVPRASVKGLEVSGDATGLTSRVWATTGSSGLRSRYDTSVLTAAGFPFYESVDSTHTDVDDQNVLDSYAKEDARLGTKPTEMWSFQVEAQTTPLVGSYRVGDWCTLKVGTDPYIPAGSYLRRITNLSGDQDGKWVTVSTGQAYSLTN